MSLLNIAHQAFELNQNGRDIVVGDIHGEFSVLEYALAEIDFDETKDRLFALGDLVDRGPESMQARDWLEKPWFHSILGNHEIHHIICHGRKSLPHDWHRFFIPFDDDWAFDVDETDYQNLITQLAKLPLAITLTSKDGPVGLVHADLPHAFDTWVAFTDTIKNNTILVEQLFEATWSRRFALCESPTRNDADHVVSDVVALFHGHNIPHERKAIAIGNRYYIETGAFLKRHMVGGGFTLVDIDQPSKPLLEAYWP